MLSEKGLLRMGNIGLNLNSLNIDKAFIGSDRSIEAIL